MSFQAPRLGPEIGHLIIADKPGDQWCVVAVRWRQAYEDMSRSAVRAPKAPPEAVAVASEAVMAK